MGADQAIPAGQHQVRMEFAYDGGGLAKGGTVSLFIDGEKAGEGRVEATAPMVFGGRWLRRGSGKRRAHVGGVRARRQRVHGGGQLGADRPSTAYFVSQLVGNVLGLTLLSFGVLALTAYLANTRARGLALAGMVLSIASIGVSLSGLGFNTYALPEISRAYVSGQQDVLVIVEAIYGGLVRQLFVPVMLLYSAGFILFGVAIWRSGVLPRPAAISFGLHAPLAEGFFRAQPNWVSVVGALLFLLGGGVIAFSVFRRPSAVEHDVSCSAGPAGQMHPCGHA